MSSELSLINGSIGYSYGSYTGTNNDIKKEFVLKHSNLPIFERYFDASNPAIVKTESDTIRIPNHFFSTGEEIEYYSQGIGTTQSIGIANTSIPGIGLTDKLPTKLYVIKVSEIDIRVAASASEALRTIPNFLDITSVGIGTSHRFKCKNQNKKVIISIDNMIQSPITSTAVTSILSKDITFFDSEVYVSGITSISSGDFLKINEEIFKVTSVGVGSTNAIQVLRGWFGTGLSTHSSSDLVIKIIGNYNIINNTIYFAEAPYGKVPILNPTNRWDELDYVGIVTGSSFFGRVFLRSGLEDGNREAYSSNYIFDDISHNFNGIDKTFSLKVNGSNVTGISTSNAILLVNDIFQGPNFSNIIDDYKLEEKLGITTVTFTGNSSSSDYDVNTSSVPRGGVILSVASTQGFGYQPLVSAGGTAIISIAGTIQSISIGNSGSGYRSGIQTTINVGIKTEDLQNSPIELVGVASVSNGYVTAVSITNPGSGYTSTNPPIVVFDSPLSYSNIPLIYSSVSASGVGTGAEVNIIVGQGSSVISFELKNLGYGYELGEKLTVSVGGTIGIPTNTSLSFNEFQLTIDNIHNDEFSAWTVGDLQIIDSPESLFNGIRRTFPILIGGNQTTIRARPGSNIDVQATLLVFVNDVLQVPGKAYTFTGGSRIKFSEAPKEGDRCRILFYRGTSDVDTLDVDILETVKIGDTLRLTSDDINLTENKRLVTDIISSEIVETNLYPGPGVTADEDLLRPVTWCRQTEDLVVNGFYVGKDRIIYEPYIQPVSNIIQNVSIASTEVFVESVKAFFDSEREYIHNGISEKPQNKIIIVSQDTLVTAEGTAEVSTSGTISSINITNSGFGYTAAPAISIAYPIGIGTTGRAVATCSISNGSVSSVAISSAGFGYTSTEPPLVLFEYPNITYEIIDKISYEGDFGIISGIKTTTVGVASTGLVFDFYIPTDSILRDSSILSVGSATTGISGIKTGYYFSVSKSNVGNGLTSLNTSGSIVGIGTSFIDNIYQVASVSIAQTAVSGVGITYVSQVVVSLDNYNGISGLGFSNFYGEYSWGKITTPFRKIPNEFNSYAITGGISTSSVVQRFNKLKYVGYSTS